MPATHPHVWFNGDIAKLDQFRLSPFAHGLHYGTTMISGISGRKMTDSRMAIFRCQDHVQRILDHIKGFGLEVAFTKQQLINAIVELCKLNLPYLQNTEDIYIRVFVFPADDELGVGSSTKTNVIIITRDLTEYLKIGDQGATVLYPGSQLFTRGGPSCAFSFFKMSGMYAAGNFWKRIALHFGAVETLAGAPVPGFLSEATGACLFIISQNHLTTPSLNSMCLNGFTRQTIIFIAEKLGIKVNKIQSIDLHDLETAHGIFLAGTWAGPVPIGEILFDPSFPEPPSRVLFDNNGANYYQWIIDTLKPEPLKGPFRHRIHPLFTQIAQIYWTIVCKDLDKIPTQITPHIPKEWHTYIE